MSREKFEALPEVAERLTIWIEFKDGFYWDTYNLNGNDFLNGAYYAFCEQEKRIEVLVKHLNRANGLILDDLEDLLK